MDLIHLHKSRNPFEFVNTVKQGWLILNQISDRLGIAQAGLAVFFTDLRKLGIVLFQNLLNLLNCHYSVFVSLPVRVCNLNTNNDKGQKRNQNQCNPIHVHADNFFEWLHPYLLCSLTLTMKHNVAVWKSRELEVHSLPTIIIH